MRAAVDEAGRRVREAGRSRRPWASELFPLWFIHLIAGGERRAPPIPCSRARPKAQSR